MTNPAAPPASAEWLAHRYDPTHDAVHFISAPRAVRRTAPFLTDENLPGAAAPVVLRRQDALAQLAGTASDRLNFIFHSAYCCSTLLANAYDRPGAAFSLKEPVLLNDLVGWRHRAAPADQVKQVLSDGLRLLAQPLRPGEVGVIKPSNVVNGLAPVMVGMRPEAGVLLLHAPLKVFLGSIANKGLWGRLWVRDLLAKQLQDGLIELGFEGRDYLLQTDLQAAAVGWLGQQALFARIAARWPGRVRTLDSEDLLARPAPALAALDGLFGVPSTDAGRAEIVAQVFSRNAKSGKAFDASDRRADQRRADEVHADEVGKVLTWAETIATQFGIPMQLPQALI